MSPEEITITVETEGVDEATEALADLADAAERANEALDGLSVRVSSGREDGREVMDGLLEEARSRGFKSDRQN